MDIDWTRVAKPQDDGYDLTVLAALEPHWTKRPRDLHASFCDGYVYPVVDAFMDTARADDTLKTIKTLQWALEQTRYLHQWTAGYRAICGFLDEFRAFTTEFGGCGCSSGHVPIDWRKQYPELGTEHAIFVSINDLGGCAQGVYHEMAHLRLEALGIGIETHDGRLILNGPDELYDSSVRFDKQRPMSAVIHGTYAWMMFTENDYWNWINSKHDGAAFQNYSFRNFDKIRKGIEEIKAHVRTTPFGAEFLSGLYVWADDLLARCDSVHHRLTERYE